MAAALGNFPGYARREKEEKEEEAPFEPGS
jgi:hypothetical protein